jgi:multiple sugar transport system permease protein
MSYDRGVKAMIAPYAIGVVALIVAPAIVTVWYAFTSFDGFSPAEFTGWETFRRVLADPELHASIAASAIFLAIALPLRLGASVGLALLANGRGRIATATRVAVYTPAVIPDPATALVWLWIVNPLFGPVGALVRLFGGTPGPLLLDAWGARATIAAVSVFALGEGFLVTLAARREISDTLYDAARVEGARPWMRLRRITLPSLAPTLALLVARDIITSMQAALVPTILLTRGGPLNATKTLPAFVYERGFVESQLGEGSAIAVLLFLMGVALLAVTGSFYLLWMRRRRRLGAAA